MEIELIKHSCLDCGLDEFGDLVFIFENRVDKDSGISSFSDKKKLYEAINDMETFGDLKEFFLEYGRLCPENEREVYGDEMLGHDEPPMIHIWPLSKLSEAGYESLITPKTTFVELVKLGFCRRLSEDEISLMRYAGREPKVTPGRTLMASVRAAGLDGVEFNEPDIQIFYFADMFKHLQKIRTYVRALLANDAYWHANNEEILKGAESYIDNYIGGILSYSNEGGCHISVDNSLSLICYLLGIDIKKGGSVTSCRFCGKVIDYRSNKLYCSDVCRNAAHRKQNRNKPKISTMYYGDKMTSEQIAKELDLSAEYVKKVIDETKQYRRGINENQ